MKTQTDLALTKFNRRTFLGIGATMLLAGGAAGLLNSCQAPSPNVKQPMPASDSFEADVEVVLTAMPSVVQILPGAPTNVWRYQGELVRGAPDNLQSLPDTYLGPVLRVQKGQKVRVRLNNDLPEETLLHWHGLIVPPAMDGHPTDAIQPGETYTYEFEVKNRAGAYWFHPHPHNRTGAQVNQGLAGLFLVSDAEEAAVDLPRAAQDITLVLQDRTFDADNQLLYIAGSADPMMEQMMGFLGERILVNGQPDFVLPVATRAYRLRLLNGSNSRIYKLAWSNGAPMIVIGTDGGLLAKPVQRPYITLGPAERIELWADFRNEPVGATIQLQSLAYTGVEAGVMLGTMSLQTMAGHSAALPNGAPFDILTVQVERSESETLTLPPQLVPLERLRVEDAVNGQTPRQFTLSMDAQMNWTINGRVFEMEDVSDEETVKLGDLEVWEFINAMPAGMMVGMASSSGGHGGHSGHGAATQAGAASSATSSSMMDFMAHPIHIHGVQFQVLERQIDEAQKAGWETIQAGYVDEGWKDTVLVMPGERVKLLLRFADYVGRYLFHCHNLEHEDTTMMRNYLIQI